MGVFDIFNRSDKKSSLQTHKCFENLYEGYDAYLYPALDEMYKYNEEEIRITARLCTKIIGGRNGRELAMLMYILRHGSSGKSREKNYGKYKALCGEDFPSLLVAGMCHYDGCVRMHSAALMAQYPKYLPLILYLYNDHVPNVRQVAENAFMTAVKNADIISTALTYTELPPLKRAERRDARSLADAEAALKSRLSVINEKDVDDIFEKCTENQCTKIFSALISDRVISAKCAEYIFSRHKTFFNERTELLYIRAYDLSFDKLSEYAQSRRGIIKQAAVQKLIETYGLWDGAEELLIDKSRAVRWLMQYYFPKLRPEFDIEAYCMSQLPDPRAVMALGELYCKAAENTVYGYALSDNAKAAAAGIYALSKIASDKYDTLYYKMISDPRPSVSRAAYKAFVLCDGSAEPQTVYEDIFSHSDNECLCRRYSSILCRSSQGIWNSMPQLIKLYSFPNDEVRDKARRAISRRSCYFTGSSRCRAEIREALLSSEDIPDALKNNIMFQTERK